MANWGASEDGTPLPAVNAATSAGNDVSPVRVAPSRWYLVIVLTVLSAIAMVDRMILSLLVEPIKAQLSMSDTQMSLILGASFAIFNTIVAVPAGWLVDRVSRKWLIAASAVFWSLCTMACGLAQSFWYLATTRAGVGVAEGTIGPGSFSLIRDGVSADRRGRAFGLLAMSNNVGGALALVGGGALLQVATRHGPYILAPGFAIQPWQFVLLVIGALGLPVALLMLTVSEPERQSPVHLARGYRESLGFVREHWRVCVPLMLYSGFVIMLVAAFAAWMPAVIGRNFGLQPQEIGMRLGPIVLFGPAAGIFIAGTAIDKLTRHGRRNGAAMVGILCTLASTPFAIAYPLATTQPALWVLAAATLVLSSGAFPVGHTLLTRIAPAHASGKLFALYSLMQTSLGFSLGPICVGLASDHMFGGEATGLGRAVSLCAAVFTLLAVTSLLWLRQSLRGFVSPEDRVVSSDGKGQDA